MNPKNQETTVIARQIGSDPIKLHVHLMTNALLGWVAFTPELRSIVEDERYTLMELVDIWRKEEFSDRKIRSKIDKALQILTWMCLKSGCVLVITKITSKFRFNL